MKLLTILSASGFLFMSLAAQAAPELYIVEPLFCKATINKTPPGWSSDFDVAGVKITSFLSMRRDCTLANSTATSVDYADKNGSLSIDDKPSIGGDFAEPLTKDGDVVKLPGGTRPGGDVELKIISSGIAAVGGKRTDVLKGREFLFKDKKDGQEYYYDLDCLATVTDKATIVVNHTKSCKNP